MEGVNVNADGLASYDPAIYPKHIRLRRWMERNSRNVCALCQGPLKTENILLATVNEAPFRYSIGADHEDCKAYLTRYDLTQDSE